MEKASQLDFVHRQLLKFQGITGIHTKIFNHIPVDIALFTPEHQYLFLNKKAEKDAALRLWVTGKTEEEYCRLSGKGPAVAIKRIHYFGEVLKTKQAQEWEEKTMDSKGRSAYRLLRLHPIRNKKGELGAVIRIGVDITARKIREDQLFQVAKRHVDLFNNCHALICIHDLTGKLLAANPSTCRLMEYREDEMIGRYIYDFMPENRRNGFIQDYLPAIRQNKTAGGVFSILSKTGKKIFMGFQNAVVDAEGPEPYVIGFSLDITERIYAEKLLLYSKKLRSRLRRQKKHSWQI